VSKPLEFEIIFKSDYHVGAGHGLGLQVDSALLRDPDKIPVIRGTVLTGLLRESLLNLLSLEPFKDYRRCQASGKTDGSAFCGQFESETVELCPVCAIFGSPRQPKRWQISSARPLGLQQPQIAANDWHPGETGAQSTTRVRVNPRTRRAEENKLFTREEGDGALRFIFSAECASDDGAAQREAEWLVASARLLRNLGAGKRRGRGECEIKLVSVTDQTVILERFAEHIGKEPSTLHEPSQSGTLQPWTLPANVEQHRCRIQVLLRTDEPLLIARRAEAGNQFETLENIAGSALRGALAWRVVRRLGAAMTKVQSNEFKAFVQLFFADAIRFSSLLPIQVAEDIKLGYPTMSTPRDMFTCELHPGHQDANGYAQGHGVWAYTWDEVPEHCPVCATPDDATGRKEGKVSLESLGGQLILNPASPNKSKGPKQSVEMHIRLEPKTGRVTTGDLYGYVSLEPGQYFAGEITCTDKDVWQRFCTLAALEEAGKVNTLRLGKASRRGHGKCSVVFTTSEQSLWHGPPLAQRVKDKAKVVLTLLSDTIIVDPWGRFAQGFTEVWLARELKLPAEAVVKIAEDKNNHALSFSSLRPIDGFNAQLGLPRSRDLALVAGSTVRLCFTGIEESELQTLLVEAEMQGIGLRCEEGFGRVAFNHPVYEKLQNWPGTALDLSPLALDNAAASHNATQLARFERDWIMKLDEALKPKAYEDARFESTARLLHVANEQTDKPITARLQQMGQQEQLLPTALTGRSKTNFYGEGDGKQGMETLLTLLDELNKLIDQEHLQTVERAQFWRRGFQLLADRIAEPARRKALEGR
jgi:CRISPR-associated protein Csx10